MGILGVPGKGKVTKPFHASAPIHNGTDRGWGNGRDVYAMEAGKAIQVATLSDYGKVIKIAHGRLIDGKITESRYCHLSVQSVIEGETVARGQKIGVLGHTGSLLAPDYYDHLHSELWLNGLRFDEQKYEQGSEPAGTPGTPIAPETTRKKSMTTLYLNGTTLSSGGTANDSTVYALAGDSPSQPWIEITEKSHPGVRVQLERNHGAAVLLNSVSWAPFKAAYAAPVAGAAVQGPVVLAVGEPEKVAAAVDALQKTAGH